jgi:hypothetical protein
LSCKLELPQHFEKDALIFLANKLNEFEFHSVDAPPRFGAWWGELESGRLRMWASCRISSISLRP